ncbi:MAG TPA: 30S ribosomal protein S12 methylthiotransferase RimO [Candidatus Deferrimicrobiaceae bacterium]|jgi:ribosomal protein S12 methylthiotransferase
MTRRAAPVPGTVLIHTLGCGKNAVDAEVMSGMLADAGFTVVSRGPADVAVVNTCGFVKEAKEESIGEVLALAAEKSKGRLRKLVVAGCLPRRYREELPGLLPEVDLFLGPGDIPSLPGLLRDMLGETAGPAGPAAPRSCVGEGALSESDYLRRKVVAGAPAAFLKVLEGCDNRCSYCTIPLIRGPLKSRDRDALLAEARMLVRSGAREISLIGQDITAWGTDRGEKGALPGLVRDIRKVRGLRWLRLLYLYPSGIDEALIDLVAEGGKIVPYLDIPIQHADPDILRRMGRRYGPDDLRRLVETLRARIPGIFLRTSVIVGFPGETQRAFHNLLDFMHEIRWDYLGVFPYSREEGTAAHGMKPQVSEAVRQERLRIVQDTQADILSERNSALVGSEVELLVEEVPARGAAVCRHRGQAPEVDGNVMLPGYRGKPGDLVRARVASSREWDLRARALPSESR